MRKSLLFAAFALISLTAFSQTDSGFGIKAGLNYNQNGDLNFRQVQTAGEDLIAGSDGKVGFHVGIFGKLDLPKIYLKPELVFTSTKSSYDIDGGTKDYEIIGPLHIFAGPAFQYTLKNDLEDVELDDVKNDFTVGAHFGVGVNLGNIGLDVRYERGFTENEAEIIGGNFANIEGRVDSRPSQIIFGLSLKM